MKRANHLIDKIADTNNLELAFWKARKGKNGMPVVEQFRNNLYQNLYQLAEQIKSGFIVIGKSHKFTIYDPKKREICAASFPDRVLHHAMMRVCHPIFERYQIDDSYASRPGKGVYAAIQKAKLNQQSHQWFLKLDVRKHFETIDHHILSNQLARLYKEERLLNMFGQIIQSYNTEEGKGLPIGNLTSQYFANHYLAVADHFIKEQLKVKSYVRYMDDMVLWDYNKNDLIEKGNALDSFFRNELKLQLKPFCLNHCKRGLPFLGYVIFPEKMHLNLRSRKRFRKKLFQYQTNLENEHWNEQQYHKHILPLLAFAKKADTFDYRTKLLHYEHQNTNQERY